jgi:nucleotide-binding universal stress UspA family protein
MPAVKFYARLNLEQICLFLVWHEHEQENGMKFLVAYDGGDASQRALALAREQALRGPNIDMIFLGIKKKSRAQKILLGSTAQYIILKGPCPVTTTK